MDGKPLGDEWVAIHIAQSLIEAEVLRASKLSIISWHIKKVFWNGVSLFDHEQTHLYNMARAAYNRRRRKGVRTYETSRQRTEPNVPTKKEFFLTPESIAEVSTKTCCANNCCQPFPRGHIYTLRSQLYLNDEFYNKQKCFLDVHG